nr:MAG TPA: hypothetical protein [Caudoviricetes sp.]
MHGKRGLISFLRKKQLHNSLYENTKSEDI